MPAAKLAWGRRDPILGVGLIKRTSEGALATFPVYPQTSRITLTQTTTYVQDDPEDQSAQTKTNQSQAQAHTYNTTQQPRKRATAGGL